MMNPERSKKGFTRYELASVIIIISVIIAIAIPVILNFVEKDRRGVDGLAAERAEDAALIEFLQNHSTSGETVVYMFTGDSEVINIYRHWKYEEDYSATTNVDIDYSATTSVDIDYSAITPPRHDGYFDTPAIGGGTPKRGKSRKIGDRELYVIVSPSGEVIYNSWRN